MQGRGCWRGTLAGSQLTEQTEVDSQKNNACSGALRLHKGPVTEEASVFCLCPSFSEGKKGWGNSIPRACTTIFLKNSFEK